MSRQIPIIPVKTITVSRIPDEGQDESLNASEPWLLAALENIFPEHGFDAASLEGKVRLEKHDGNVHLDGALRFTHHPPCARCGENFARHESLKLHALLTPSSNIHDESESDEDEEAPRHKSGRHKPVKGHKEEAAFTLDDLEFSVFENDRFNLGEIIHDTLATELPYNYYCRDDCKGLCSRCGHNLNEGPCACRISLT